MSGYAEHIANGIFKWKSQESSDMCPISTMKDMYDIVKESDKVVTF